MKEAQKILFISQEITPYLPETDMSKICRMMPQYVQEDGREMRAFMPRFGCINERRNQLHEVIRLSGMNLIIDDTDHPLIIKVASIQSARMQVYFIDNEDYFQRKYTVADADGKECDDNDERTIFFSRGVLETVKKLRWAPNVVHCHGWMSALAPLYIKKAYNDDPFFKDAKIVISLYDNEFTSKFKPEFKENLKLDGITDKDLEMLGKDSVDYTRLMELAIANCDGVIMTTDNTNDELKSFIEKSGVKSLVCTDKEEYSSKYLEFYDSLFA